MPTRGWRYRAASVAGTAGLTAGAVLLANHPVVQSVATAAPVLSRLPATTLAGADLGLAVATATVVACAVLGPLFKPRPRRVLDTLSRATRRTAAASVALAAVGYFDYTYRLPRTTLVVATVVLLVALPSWFLLIRRRPAGGTDRAVVVGDDPVAMADLLDAVDAPVAGYVSPPTHPDGEPRPATDGGVTAAASRVADLDCLGGLSRLEEVLVEHDVDTVALAFSRPDRAEFFGVLATCYDRGVTAAVHPDHADTVLVADDEAALGADLREVDLEPWDAQDYVLKRAFDVAFAAVALVALAPLLVVVAAAVRLDSPGPALYAQERTAAFGDTFTVRKFRTMVTGAEAGTGAVVSPADAGDVDPRVTRVGRLLRPTHVDEVPQLWTVLRGEMSVVGPRPERPELDADIETGVDEWSRRWFVKPGLTGLAQVEGATGLAPDEKLRYDLEYIRRQSFRFDVAVVVRQLWTVALDVAALVADAVRGERADGEGDGDGDAVADGTPGERAATSPGRAGDRPDRTGEPATGESAGVEGAAAEREG
jgi:lipopolysaccharide/colanic/teichoic acid biosynthesis glycosyltransferase